MESFHKYFSFGVPIGGLVGALLTMVIGYYEGNYWNNIIVLVRIMFYMVSTLRLHPVPSLIINLIISVTQLGLELKGLVIHCNS
jgi:hypothetical protein